MRTRIGTRGIGTLVGVALVVSLGAGVFAAAAPLRGAHHSAPAIYRASSADNGRAALTRRRKKNHFRIIANPAPQGDDGFGPGKSRPLSFTIKNPFTFKIRLNALTVQITSGPAGCDLSWVSVQSPISATTFIDIPHNGTATLDAAHQPQITLEDLPNLNQDACKAGAFTFRYTATAVKPT